MSLKQIDKDFRGKIYLFKWRGREFLLLETKKRFGRGGDYHQSIQHDEVLVGTVVFMSIKEGKEKIKTLNEGETISFQQREPHMLIALTDCLVLEWLEGPFEKQYYEPYRKLITCIA